MKTKKLSLIVFLVMISVFMSVVGVMAYDSNLVLENKNSSWVIILDTKQATLNYTSAGSNFEYSLAVTDLLPSTGYSLIYYADFDPRFANWGGNNPGALIESFNTDVGGDYNSGDKSKNLGINLPSAPDWNINPTPNYCNNSNGFDSYLHCSGAKIWIVKTSDLTTGNLPLINWNSTEWLFETDLIHYSFDNSQSVGGDLVDTVSISVSPSSLDFGAIPRGANITKEAINDPIIINTTGSETQSNNVCIYADVIGTDETFFESLLELNDAGWTDILSIAFVIPEGTSENYDARLQGNTAIYPSGPKNAKIVYTAYGCP